MNNLVPVTYNNERILTTEQLAQVYKTTINNIKNNFNNNLKHFEEGKHYYKLEGSKLKAFKSQVNNIDLPINKFASHLYLWTERGADRHCKILDTDKAWEQFDHLEETYFRVKENKPLTALEELRLHYKVLEEHREEIKAIRDDVKDLKENSPLYTIECKEIQSVVQRVGTRALGGHGSRAYNDRSLRGKIYSDIQHQLRREFGVRRYEAIKRCQFQKAKEIIQAYKVPTILQDQIVALNNQISVEEVI
ncbi:ORF6C domain-containing protein [Clostridium sp. Mt-5]|uniref:ORF6C domain-containing protein n=1 Tax=Clostridium moutaii TaxID=3240932 RepID=A0ABV4BTC9_9CLOT